ncbi:MAG TPA: Mov34/MPN/PAD-1 family protein [Acidobacteriota bacterium]|nr:Mov34/MPN/PAD-1 family protein [Acidobacteriota bacterium]
MDKPVPIRIKIRPIRHKAAKARLPGRVKIDYPHHLVVPFIRAETLQRLKHYAASDLGYELGGVLVGRAGRSSRRHFIEIVDFIPATSGVSRRASFEFTNEAQQKIHETKEAQFKELQILGWFHTHPGYGIFLSSADQFIDENYFTESFHVAVVLDPSRPDVEAGVFVWDDRARIRVPFFFPEG